MKVKDIFKYFTWKWCLFYFEPTESHYAFHCDWTWFECKYFLHKLKKDKDFKDSFIMNQKKAIEKYPFLFKKL